MTSNEVLQQINKSQKETERLTRKYESLFSNEQKELARRAPREMLLTL